MRNLVFAICITFIFIGCATESSSSGFGRTFESASLPPGIPTRIGVIQFQGRIDLAILATDQFTGGLYPIGFDVVERDQIMSILKELEYHYSENVDATTRAELKRQLGVEALFVGSIIAESSEMWVDSHLNIRLVDVETGKILWTANVHDPRTFALSASVESSVNATVNNALDILKGDIRKMY